LGLLLQTRTSLGFFHAWMLVTLSDYLLITPGRKTTRPALSYAVFSLAAAYLILAGLALGHGASGSPLLADLRQAGALSPAVFGLLASGFVIAVGGLGLHLWLPDAYAEAEDDVTAILASLVGKAGLFGLLAAAIHLGGPSAMGGPDIPYLLGWLGLLTAAFGALMALLQEDAKRLLAYASMEQLGYMVAGVALMSHAGWVTALYLSVSHFLYQGLLLLAVAGVIYRTGTRTLHRLGGLIDPMPVSFFCALISALALSGLPSDRLRRQVAAVQRVARKTLVSAGGPDPVLRRLGLYLCVPAIARGLSGTAQAGVPGRPGGAQAAVAVPAGPGRGDSGALPISPIPGATHLGRGSAPLRSAPGVSWQPDHQYPGPLERLSDREYPRGGAPGVPDPGPALIDPNPTDGAIRRF